jgi:hypothetical protein
VQQRRRDICDARGRERVCVAVVGGRRESDGDSGTDSRADARD